MKTTKEPHFIAYSLIKKTFASIGTICFYTREQLQKYDTYSFLLTAHRSFNIL